MNANGPRISGLGAPEAAAGTQSGPESVAAGAEAELPMTERPRNKIPLRTISLVAAILMAAAAGGYTCVMHQKVEALRAQLVRTQAGVQAALGTLNNLRIPKDVTADLASLEATVNKFKAATEARQKALDDGVKPIPALESKLTGQANALASKQAQMEQDLKSFQEKSEVRMATIITVLKNQDKIFRQLVGGKTEPGKEP